MNNRVKMSVMLFLVLSVLTYALPGYTEDKKIFKESRSNVPVQVKLVINENGKEIKSYLYDFQAGNGQEETYKNASTTPYVDKATQETRWFDLKSEIAVTPLTTDANTTVNSKISMTVNLAPMDSTLPLLTSFDYVGASVHPKAEFLKVFSGALKDLTYTVDIYIKAGS